MASSEVQRTLVKSPPELWAELSDPASLARHLGHFGEIRIARIEPETTVEWEADSVHGAVRLKPSGWGTKVTLSITRKEPPPDADASPEPDPLPTAAEEPDSTPPATEGVEPAAERTEPALTTAEEPESAPAAAAEPNPIPAVAEARDPEPTASEETAPEPRPGFFTRLFRRRKKEQPVAEPEPEQPQAEAPVAEQPTAEEPTAEQPTAEQPTAEQPITEQPQTEPTDLAAELAEIEEALAEQDATLLSDVLDRLGAAHHRPFSRG